MLNKLLYFQVREYYKDIKNHASGNIYNDMGNAQNLVNQIYFLKNDSEIVWIKIVIYANTFNCLSPKFGLKRTKNVRGNNLFQYWTIGKRAGNILCQDVSIPVKLKFFFLSFPVFLV